MKKFISIFFLLSSLSGCAAIKQVIIPAEMMIEEMMKGTEERQKELAEIKQDKNLKQ